MSTRKRKVGPTANLPSSSVEAAKRRRAVFIFTAFVAAIVLLVLWGWGRESRRDERRQALETAGAADEADAGSYLEKLPETPPREEVGRVLRELAPFVSMCSKGESGVIRIHLTIQGKSGSVQEATVAKQFSGTDIAKCATSIVLEAQFPRFRKKNLTVAFPYTFRAPSSDASIAGDAAVVSSPTGDAAPSDK